MLVVNYYKKINMNKVEDELKDKRKSSDINKMNEAKRVKKKIVCQILNLILLQQD